jgi:hypothetical protein
VTPIICAKAIAAGARSPSNNPARALKYPLDKHLYASPHLVECCFSQLKQFRRGRNALRENRSELLDCGRADSVNQSTGHNISLVRTSNRPIERSHFSNSPQFGTEGAPLRLAD